MILDSFKLDGKVALVTGASRGLGQAMALGLSEAGADIAGLEQQPAVVGSVGLLWLGHRRGRLTGRLQPGRRADVGRATAGDGHHDHRRRGNGAGRAAELKIPRQTHRASTQGSGRGAVSRRGLGAVSPAVQDTAGSRGNPNRPG